MTFSNKRNVLILMLALISLTESMKLNLNTVPDAGIDNSCWLGKIYKKYNDIGDMSVADMIIPGTHDSGMILDQSLNIDEGTIAEYMKTVNPNDKGLRKDFFHFYTQYHTIKNQLAIGIRLFDVRVKKLGFTDDKIKGHKYTKDDLYIFHGEFPFLTLVLPQNLREILSEIVKFLDQCKNDFVILKVKLDDKGDSQQFFDTLYQVLEAYNKPVGMIHYARKIPTFQELTGKIWLIPDKFDPKVLKETIRPQVNENNPLFVWNEEKEACFIRPYKKYGKYERYKTKEKKEEFQQFVSNQSDDKKKNIISCFGFNVSKVAGVSAITNTVVKSKKHPGTSKGEYLFNLIFTERKDIVERGFISIDWATSANTDQIIKRSKEIFQSKSKITN